MNMKSKYCILMVLAVILINCILYGCSEKIKILANCRMAYL